MAREQRRFTQRTSKMSRSYASGLLSVNNLSVREVHRHRGLPFVFRNLRTELDRDALVWLYPNDERI